MEKNTIYSERVKSKGRSYFFDLRQASNGNHYLSITESNKNEEGTYEQSRIVVFEEDVDAFTNAVERLKERFWKILKADDGPAKADAEAGKE